MNILLLQPPISDFYQTKVRLQPLGLAYIKATILKADPTHRVEIHDLQNGYKRRSIPLPKELTYLKEYYNKAPEGPFSSFYHYYRFGATEHEITRIVESQKWELIGISSLFSAYFSDVLELCQIIKRLTPAPIVIGGGHPSAVRESTLQNSCIDFAIYGEGEKPFLELVEALDKKRSFEDVSSLIYRHEQEIRCNPFSENYPLEKIPIPNLKELGSYLYEGKPMAFLMSSRACPHRCDFCSSSQVFGLKYRQRSNESILKELDQRYHEGFKVIDFEDDNLTANRKKALDLFRHIIKRKYDLRLLAMNGLSYHSLDSELLSVMKDAGFHSLNLSLVTHSDKVKLNSDRPHTLSKFKQIVETAGQLKLSTTAYLIFGLPTQMLGEMIESVIFLAQQQVLIGASPFYLIPGTPIEKHFSDFDYSSYRSCRLTALAHPTEECSRESLFTLFITCRIINYVKSFDQKFSLSDILERAEAMPLKEMIIEGKPIHPKFDMALFQNVWNKIGSVTTQSGASIEIRTNH